MTLSVIGAGLGRTGTLSLKDALELLGVGRCFHMTELLVEPQRIDHWVGVGRGEPRDWEKVFAGYGATVDWPAATYWRELAGHYPRARVILSRRDAAGWFASTQRTIFNPALAARLRPDSPMGELVRLCVHGMFEGRIADREHCIAVYERHNRAVIEALPPERLLVYEAGQGWEPLCRFLGVPVPDVPFPHANAGDAFEARFRVPTAAD